MKKIFFVTLFICTCLSVFAMGQFDAVAEAIADVAASVYDAPLGRYPSFYTTGMSITATVTSTGKKYIFNSETCGYIMNALIVHLYEELNGTLWWDDSATAWSRKAKLELMRMGFDSGDAELFMAHGRNKVVEIYMQKYSRK